MPHHHDVFGFGELHPQPFARHAKAPPANRRLPEAQAFVPVLADVGGGAIRAEAAELAANPRARSAVLRVAEKLPQVEGRA